MSHPAAAILRTVATERRVQIVERLFLVQCWAWHLQHKEYLRLETSWRLSPSVVSLSTQPCTLCDARLVLPCELLVAEEGQEAETTSMGKGSDLLTRSRLKAILRDYRIDSRSNLGGKPAKIFLVALSSKTYYVSPILQGRIIRCSKL